MKISSIKQYTNTLKGFKSNITFDIGGSQREGSCKIYYATSDDDQKIYSAKTTVNELGQTRFKDSNDFIDHIVKKVKTVQDNNANNIKDMGFPAEENILRSMTIFIPSYTDKAFAYYLPNHRNQQDRSLKDLDFADIKDRLIEKGVKVAPDMKFMLLQDAMGTGLAVAKKLYDHDMLSKGKYYTACITGGGCGVSNIEMTDDDYVIVKSTGSAYSTDNMELKKVSKAGASAPSLCKNFCRAFGLNEEMVEDILACHKSEFALSNPITYKKDIKTEPLKDLLLATGKYEIVSEDDKEFTLKVKKEYEKLYGRSRQNAIDKYCLAFARFAIIKKTECSNGLIITGPLAKAVNKAAKEIYGFSVSEWVNYHLYNSFNTFELDKTQKTYDFKIICDERFFLEDNTACRKFAHEAKFVTPNRGNWVKVNIESLKEPMDGDY